LAGALVLATLLAASIPARAQNFAADGDVFRLEWNATTGAKGPELSGYVYNTTNRRAVRMRLGIDGLDGAGQVVGRTETWVVGSVPPNNRSYFEAKVPPAVSYRVAILSFSWVEDGDGGLLRRW